MTTYSLGCSLTAAAAAAAAAAAPVNTNDSNTEAGSVPYAHVFYFQNVKNGKALRERLQAGDTRLAYAFVDGRVVLDSFQLLAAATRAMAACNEERLKTHNVHSEIVYNLSPNTNIGEAFRRFGVNDDSTSLAVIKLSGNLTEVEQDLVDLIDGTLVSISELGSDVQLDSIRKYYKLTQEDLATDREQLVNTIVTAMALKGLAVVAATSV
ncbi:kinase binding protein CGI-121-domain-containing protein [Syncephalis plumigaleata]|nr:kinase binding protein CGI-121-domain-containing protein [Syncephalis plumigaleata]